MPSSLSSNDDEKTHNTSKQEIPSSPTATAENTTTKTTTTINNNSSRYRKRQQQLRRRRLQQQQQQQRRIRRPSVASDFSDDGGRQSMDAFDAVDFYNSFYEHQNEDDDNDEYNTNNNNYNTNSNSNNAHQNNSMFILRGGGSEDSPSEAVIGIRQNKRDPKSFLTQRNRSNRNTRGDPSSLGRFSESNRDQSIADIIAASRSQYNIAFQLKDEEEEEEKNDDDDDIDEIEGEDEYDHIIVEDEDENEAEDGNQNDNNIFGAEEGKRDRILSSDNHAESSLLSPPEDFLGSSSGSSSPLNKNRRAQKQKQRQRGKLRRSKIDSKRNELIPEDDMGEYSANHLLSPRFQEHEGMDSGSMSSNGHEITPLRENAAYGFQDDGSATNGEYLNLSNYYGRGSSRTWNLKRLGYRFKNRIVRGWKAFWRGELSLVLLFLAILGIASALVAIIVDYLIEKIFQAKFLASDFSDNYSLGYSIYMAFSFVFATIAAACVHKISPHSSGSGIPEMKSILSGIVMNRYLSFATLCSKVIGLLGVFGAGLSVGKEGPFVHIASALGYQLLKIPIFRRIKQNDYLRTQMLATACAAGVVATFGAPVGGVLFSIEVTSTYYLVSNLWKGFYCAGFGAVIFYVFRRYEIIGNNSTQVTLFTTDFEFVSYDPIELMYFALLGVICGVVGAFFNWIVGKLVGIRRTYKPFRKSRYFLVFTVVFITTAISFPLPYLRETQNSATAQLFSKDPLPGWDRPSVILNLFIFWISKLFLTASAIVLPIPCGLFTPVFTIGGAIGRALGEIIVRLTTTKVVAGGYAVVGAAAMASGVTRTLSTAMIVFELTGQLSHMLPVLIATVVATGIGNTINISIYDTILKLRGLPYLTDIRQMRNYGKIARDVMRDQIDFITLKSTYKDIARLLKTSKHIAYPLVDSLESMILIGSVQRGNLFRMKDKFEHLLATKMATQEDIPELTEDQVHSLQETLDLNIFDGNKSLSNNKNDENENENKNDIEKDSNHSDQSMEKKKDYVNNDNDDNNLNNDTDNDNRENDVHEGIFEKEQQDNTPLRESPEQTISERIQFVEKSPSLGETFGANSKEAYQGLDSPARKPDSPIPEDYNQYSSNSNNNNNNNNDDYMINENQQENQRKEISSTSSFSSSPSPLPFMSQQATLLEDDQVHLDDEEFQHQQSQQEEEEEEGDHNQNEIELMTTETMTTNEPNQEEVNETQNLNVEGEERFEDTRERNPSILDYINLSRNLSFDPDELPAVQIDPAPFQINDKTPLVQVHFIFVMLGLSHAFVVNRGRLVGVVTKKDLINLSL